MPLARPGGLPGPALRLATHRDPQLASIFRQMRAVVGVSEITMARAVGTDVAVIMDLEDGVLDQLPPWPQMVRIAERYASIARIDTRPILARLAAVAPVTTTPASTPGYLAPLAASQQPVAPKIAPPGGAGAALSLRQTQDTAQAPTPTGRSRVAPSTRSAHDEAARQRRRRRMRRTSLIAIPLLFLLAPVVAVVAAPQPVYQFTTVLPKSMQMPLRGVLDAIVFQTAPVRDGLRWIDAGDPRLRKGDLKPAQ
jgi:hypothetical protein